MDSDSRRRTTTAEQRERLVVAALHEYGIPNLYFALNRVLKTNFPPVPNLSEQVREKLPQVTERLTRLLCAKLIVHLQVCLSSILFFNKAHFNIFFRSSSSMTSTLRTRNQSTS